MNSQKMLTNQATHNNHKSTKVRILAQKILFGLQLQGKLQESTVLLNYRLSPPKTIATKTKNNWRKSNCLTKPTAAKKNQSSDTATKRSITQRKRNIT